MSKSDPAQSDPTQSDRAKSDPGRASRTSSRGDLGSNKEKGADSLAPASRERRAAPVRPAGLRGRPDDGNAFFPDPNGGPARPSDDLAEQLGEEFVASATSAEETIEDDTNALVPEELGGPFLEETAETEFARTTDDTNPLGGDKEPFPTAMRSEK